MAFFLWVVWTHHVGQVCFAFNCFWWKEGGGGGSIGRRDGEMNGPDEEKSREDLVRRYSCVFIDAGSVD